MFQGNSNSAAVLAEGIREAYSDLFSVNTRAQELAVDEVKNKLRTLTQGQNSENVLGLMAKTFKSLADLADWKGTALAAQPEEKKEEPPKPPEEPERQAQQKSTRASLRELHYNIQIVLPETRDISVFDAIFESLNKHLLH
ncbi:MAG: DUF5343 domain-containing protein [Bryobacteraceae bacterium]